MNSKNLVENSVAMSSAKEATAKTEWALEVESLSKQFPNQGQVLADLNFKVRMGEFISVIGPSGCGKSTLLYLLAGLVPKDEGEIKVLGKALKSIDASQISLVFQEANLLPWKNALQNVAFPLELRRVPKKEREERAMALLQLVGLENYWMCYPHELSGGMKQRVSIARGLVLEPQILLMDEPFAALDEQTRGRMCDELLKIWERTKKTIVFVTHSLNEAVYLSDAVYILQGRPARLSEIVPVNLERPRTDEQMDSLEFGRIRQKLRRALARDIHDEI